jgi:hypothetical protein
MCDGHHIGTANSGEDFESCILFNAPKHLSVPPTHAIVDSKFYNNRICGKIDCGYKPENDPFGKPLKAPLEVGPPELANRKRKESPPNARVKRARPYQISQDWSEVSPSASPNVLEKFSPDPHFRKWPTPPSLERFTFQPPATIRTPVIPVFLRKSSDPTPEPRYFQHSHITPHFPHVFQPNSFPGFQQQISPSPRKVVSTGGLRNIRIREAALEGSALLRVMLGSDDDTPSRMADEIARLSLGVVASVEGEDVYARVD